jgi:glycosidase
MLSPSLRSSLFLWIVSGILLPMRVVGQADSEQSLRSFIGWIPMQPVTAGQQITIDMHRFYFSSPGINERMLVVDSPDGRYEAQFDESSFELNVAVDKNTTGLIEIPLQVFARVDTGVSALGRKDTGIGVSQENVAARPLLEAVLLIAVQSADGHTFVYRAPGRSAGNVSVIGAFNGWDEKSHVMKSVGEGVYELFVRLPPGSHPYQFAVDGRRVLDPENPEEFEDSSGVASSIARVGKTDRGDPPVVFAQEAVDGRVVFRIVPGFAKVEQISTVLQLPDGSSRSVRHKTEDNVVTVDVADAPEGSWVRMVVADTMGNISNAARVPVRPTEGFLWQDGIVYHVLPDRFANGDTGNDGPLTDERVSPAANFQGGDFSGIRKKIMESYFRDMGVNVLRLGPVLRGPDIALDNAGNPGSFRAAYDGRAPVSHEEVEPRLGGAVGLMDLMAAAKTADLQVMADLQLDHVHLAHTLLKQQPELFAKRGSAKEEWARRFDYDNPEAVKFLISHAVNFARKFDFDAYRVEHIDEVRRGFWWRYRTAVRTAVDPRRKSPFYTLGEINQNRSAIAGFVGPNMLDGQVDWPLYRTVVEVFAQGNTDMSALERSLAESEVIYGKESIMSPSLGAPDLPRFISWAAGEKGQPGDAEPTAEAYLKLKLALTFLMSIDGVPSIFYGDEIGLSGASAPESHRMMRWDDALTSEERSVREHFAKVATTRGKHPALRYGSRRLLVAEGHRYAFVRAHLGDAVLAVWNRGLAQTEFSLRVAPEMPDGDYVDAISGQKILVMGGRAKFRVAPQASALFVAQQTAGGSAR